MSIAEKLGFKIISKTSFGIICAYQEKNTLLVQYKPDLKVDLIAAQNIIETVYPILKSKGLKFLISDNSEVGINSTMEARELLSSNVSLKLVKAHAIVVKELSVRILITGFVAHHKPNIPTETFNNLGHALEWIQNC